MAEDGAEVYDLLFLVDATISMTSYLASLNTSLPKIIAISALTGSFENIGLIAYRDYCDDDDECLIEWTGWMRSGGSATTGPDVDLIAAAKQLQAGSGGDFPEATKTGLAKAYEVMREGVTTIILLYTDAPPHTTSNAHIRGCHRNEQKALKKSKSYGGYGPLFMDWVHASRMMAGKGGKKRGQVFSILEPSMRRSEGSYYTLLSTISGGACLYPNSSRPNNISRVTVDLLLAWMGIKKTGTDTTELAAKMARYKSLVGIDEITKESNKDITEDKAAASIEEVSLDSTAMEKYIPRRKTPVQNFAQRYQTDDTYKFIVVKELQKIIEQDVSAISLNPVFGSLWRAVCNDRSNPNREGLISSFGLQIGRIANADEKARMKIWLEESYDYAAEIEELIEKVPSVHQFPCVFLDPTLSFTKTSDIAETEEEDDRSITEFRRDELLEIGRSCNWRILQRLGRVLTRLTFVETEKEIPTHIANAKDSKVTRIPMALASEEFEHKFWKILLHIVVPGTMLSARPAALLAALTVLLGIQPLYKTADTEMLLWRNRWNNIEFPETWNVSCLSLLLDADRSYRDRQHHENSKTGSVSVEGFLNKADIALFDRLVSYKMLESNLNTTLTATIGWKPDKTAMPIGPLVLCLSCHYPRSVTIMGPKSKCGHCLAKDYASEAERQERITGRVSKDDSEATTEAVWVECSTPTCQAQYVIYSPEALMVRAICHYCRQQSSVSEEKRKLDPAPTLKCKQCFSKVIFPEEYRNADMSDYHCIACSNGRITNINVETTATMLCKENGKSWLLSNKDSKLEIPFEGTSLFKQISASGTDNFTDLVTLFPATKDPLNLNAKVVRNTDILISQLQSWMSRRQTESGTCSLCFSSKRKTDLHPACGRRGCSQRVCSNCLGGWYGLNAAGLVINTAALSCPFCRRAPAAKTLHGYGMGIHAVGDLKLAVEEKGEWIYAWCSECAKAKRFVERVCAQGPPAGVSGWSCEFCRSADTRRMLENARKRGEKELKVKECPKCKVLTQKSWGCGHMTCTCGQHWCWFCGVESNESDIYEHMEAAHGGLYENGEDDSDYEDQ